LEHEELLIGFWTAPAGCFYRHRSRRVGACNRPVRGDLVDFGDDKLYLQRNGLKHTVIRLADRICTDARREVLRHENAIGCVELHHRFRIGLIQRVFVVRKYSGNCLFVCIHDFRPW